MKLNAATIAVGRNSDDNIVIVIPGHFELTVDEQTAAELGMALYAKALRMPEDEAGAFFGQFNSPPKH